MSKYGFTLAEALLTLAIIGVVAALTIPAVVIRVQKDQYVVGLKKAYNTLKSVEGKAVQENGQTANWDWVGSAKTVFDKYFKPHFDILKDCGITTDAGCFHGANETSYLSGVKNPNDYNSNAYYKFITPDGVAYAYLNYTSSSAEGSKGLFYVDINGKKGPNIFGRDIFLFDVFKHTGIKPSGAFSGEDGKTPNSSSYVDTQMIYGCNKTSSEAGYYCGAKVLTEGSMNY